MTSHLPCAPKTGWLSGETYCRTHGRAAGWPCAASDDLRDELRALLARHAAAGTPAPVVIRRIQDVIESPMPTKEWGP